MESLIDSGILCSLVAALALLARNDTWNLVMLSKAKHLFAIAHRFQRPSHSAQRLCSSPQGIT
ncbi:MAG: hypothetical protein K2N70_05665 [Helicobacter sp.]|nr:hypothetical protein [Helicobacter sp.]